MLLSSRTRVPEGPTAPAPVVGAPAGRHVLIVEDDRLIATALAMRLRASGYRVTTAPDLHAAADRIVDDHPDVAVLDINLPDGNGLQLAGRLRSLSRTVEVPLVVVTASRDPRYREQAERLAAPFVEKPFVASELIGAIERACTERAPTGAGQRLSRGSTQA